MLYTIKQSPIDFNLLYLDSGESLINSTKCYFLNNNTMTLEDGVMHVNTRSIIFQPKEISESLTKLKFSESLNIKFFTVDEIISNQFLTNSQNLHENPIIPTAPKNTNNHMNIINNNLILNAKYATSNTNYSRKKSTNTPSNNYSNLALNNQLNQNQNDFQPTGSLISNRKASSNNGKNNNANNSTNAHLQNNYLNTQAGNQMGNSQVSPGNNNSPPNFNSVNYLVNNDASKSTVNSIYFEFKISNFCEIFNKLIKENFIYNNTLIGNSNNYFYSNPNSGMNINNISHNKNQLYFNSDFNTNNNNQNTNTNNSYMQISNKNINNNNNANFHLKKRHTVNINIPNSNLNNPLNNNNINSQNNLINFNINNANLNNSNNVNNIFTFDLQNFFYENNLNYQCLVDLLSNINSNFNRETQKDKDLNKTKYLICLAKCNKTHNITRWPITNYDINISSKKYFFVIEGEENLINNFIEDYKFISEKINKTEEDTFSIFNEFVNKKLKHELKKIFAKEHFNKKLMENLNHNVNSNDFPLDSKMITQNDNKRASMNANINSNNEEKFNRKISLKNALYNNNNNSKPDKIPNTVTFDKNILINPKNEATENPPTPILKAYFVSRIIPEGVQKGILLVYSNSIIRFKPVTNNYKYAKRESSLLNSSSGIAKQYLEIKLSKVESITKYRYLFRYKAINIFLFQSQRSKIFDFETERDFNEFYNFMLKNCKNLDKTTNDLEHHTNLWKFGSLSNFEYLMYLNNLASRSFSDLSQYPIFPWIISNYEECEELDLTDAKNFRDLSKPIGALTQYKLEHFLQNYTEMKIQNPKSEAYLYSEHYSNPAHIIYFLVRSHPQFQMKFKSGSLGPQERLFNSIRDCWSYILNINNEVKELIPEFYSGTGDFLVNVHGLSIGESNSGAAVHDVLLPKWAKSPAHFISVCKSALESKYVSSNLHLWIDLIFGCKQQNESAVAANNLYYYMTYESAIEKNCDKEFKFENEFKKQAFDAQLLEFGQVPRLLFNKPHPAKKAFSIYSANYFISNSAGSQEEILVKIEHLIKDNKRLEDQCARMEREKMEEKEMLIKSQEEIELKRKEKIKRLKDNLNERELEYKKAIEKMIEHNNQMKMQFENYDELKQRFYNEIIHDLESNNEKELDGNFTNNNQIFKYIKSLETSINKLKLKETQLSDTLENLNSTFNKTEENKAKLKEQIQNIKKKINKIPH